jgi:hypothetical protein
MTVSDTDRFADHAGRTKNFELLYQDENDRTPSGCCQSPNCSVAINTAGIADDDADVWNQREEDDHEADGQREIEAEKSRATPMRVPSIRLTMSWPWKKATDRC